MHFKNSAFEFMFGYYHFNEDMIYDYNNDHSHFTTFLLLVEPVSGVDGCKKVRIRLERTINAEMRIFRN